MKEAFILARRHDSKRFEVVRGPKDSHQSHRAFLKQFRGKHQHPEFAEVYPVKPTGRFRLKASGDRKAEPKPSLFQRALDVFKSDPPKAVEVKTTEAPTAPEANIEPPKNRRARRAQAQKSKPSSAFAERFAAAQPPAQT